MSQTTNAGIVTAYGAAVRGGYQGTYSDFCTDLANLAQVMSELSNLSATAETLVAGSSATATYANGVFTFGIPRGDKGEKGDTGKGIQSVSLLSVSSLEKTYRITFTDGTYFDYVVTDGKSIVGTTLNSDYTLTITYNDGTTWTSSSIRGATGATPNLTIGTVTTGAAGTDASASITGTAENPVLNLTIPKGADGDVSSASIASVYDATKTYAVGDYVWYSGQLYKCTTAISIAEAWTSAHWEASKIADDVKDLKSSINEHSNIISTNLMGIDVQENLYPCAADWRGTWLNSDPVNMGVSSEKFQGYPCVYSSQSWRRYCKNIPVEAGKTYTFECWLKHTTAGAAYIYITYNSLTVDPATVTPASKQFKNTPANEWIKLSLTFACTASGNISPFAHSGTSAFYIAKYNLVEGDAVFSLDNALAEKANIESVSGIGDYLRYDFSLSTSLGTYWNQIIDKEIPAGTKVKLIFDYYSGEYLSYVRIDGKKADNTWQNGLCRITSPVHGGEAKFTATEKYVALRVQLSRSQDESNVTAAIYLATNSELGITNELMGMKSQRVFHVEKNGSGDFASLVEAINTACQYMDSVVYIGAGEWDIIDEFGAAYMSAVSSDNSTWGLWLKNRIHLIGTAKTVIKAVNATGSTNFDNIKEYFSVFNAGEKGFTLENINIEDENIRYSVHDDRGYSGSEPYTNKYIRCSMIHKNGKYSDCIGAGLGVNQTVEIRGCYFEGDLGRTRLVYWHGNNDSSVTDALGKLTVCDNYFAQDGTFNLTRYGQSDTDTIAYVSNNSFGTAPSVYSGSTAPYDNMRMVMWNNEVRTT